MVHLPGLMFVLPGSLHMHPKMAPGKLDRVVHIRIRTRQNLNPLECQWNQFRIQFPQIKIPNFYYVKYYVEF